MEVLKQRVMIVCQLFILVVVIWALAYGVYRLAGIALPDVPAAILGGAATIAATHYLQRQREIESAQRQRKVDAYGGFLGIIFSDIVVPTHQAREAGKTPKIDSTDITGKIYGISAQIGLWAGNEALKEYGDLLNNLIKPGEADTSKTIFDGLGDLILVFRKDLGYRPGKLTARDLYPLFGVPRDLILKLPESQAGDPGSPIGAEMVMEPPVSPTARRGAPAGRPVRRSRRQSK